MICRQTLLNVALLLGLSPMLALAASPDEQSSTRRPSPAETAAERGYRLLTEKAYIPEADFDQETFDNVWRVWPEPLRSEAEKATPDERRAMAFSRYGLTTRPGDDSGKPLQYVVDERGDWTMNCFACHGGKLQGKTLPGLPNSHFALQTLTEEIRETKVRMQKKLTRMDYGSLVIPLGNTNGATNAVMFGVVLLAYRDKDLVVHTDRPMPKMVHHDMDAPAWWHFRRKRQIYIDGFAEKGHRPLMQFMLVKENGPEKFMHDWDDEFRDIYAYLESLEPPRNPHKVDDQLAAEGKIAFEAHCARCHGTYGEDGSYPEVNVPLKEIGTDPVRYHALSPEGRAHYGQSWFGRYGESNTIDRPPGYVAPPLDGVWASAPYLHNGSVPTLWHLLHPDGRPQVWRRSENGYDTDRVGLQVETFDALPDEVRDAKERRTYFDTSRFGMSNAGHTFPDELDESQKRAVLEYLKTL
ncbi:MAG: c-type cytochrome [Pirellulaceae bacterium]